MYIDIPDYKFHITYSLQEMKKEAPLILVFLIDQLIGKIGKKDVEPDWSGVALARNLTDFTTYLLDNKNDMSRCLEKFPHTDIENILIRTGKKNAYIAKEITYKRLNLSFRFDDKQLKVAAFIDHMTCKEYTEFYTFNYSSLSNHDMIYVRRAQDNLKDVFNALNMACPWKPL